jgi:hypothetical protein
MDPDVLLHKIRENIAKVKTMGDMESITLTHEILEDFEELDGWLVKGGFTPSDWYRRAK